MGRIATARVSAFLSDFFAREEVPWEEGEEAEVEVAEPRPRNKTARELAEEEEADWEEDMERPNQLQWHPRSRA